MLTHKLQDKEGNIFSQWLEEQPAERSRSQWSLEQQKSLCSTL